MSCMYMYISTLHHIHTQPCNCIGMVASQWLEVESATFPHYIRNEGKYILCTVGGTNIILTL